MWQTNLFSFQILTSLTITGLAFDGSSVHVIDRTLCPIDSSWCCPSTASYEDKNNPCFLKNQNFERPSSLNVFKGFFVLNGPNAKLNLKKVIFNSFYAVYNYTALIFDSYQNSNIVAEDLIMKNVFFLKGIFSMDYVNSSTTTNFSFTLKNTIISQWNYYDIFLEYGNEIIFGENQNTTVLFAISNPNTISIYNFSLIDSNVYYFMFCCLRHSSISSSTFSPIVLRTSLIKSSARKLD